MDKWKTKQFIALYVGSLLGLVGVSVLGKPIHPFALIFVPALIALLWVVGFNAGRRC